MRVRCSTHILEHIEYRLWVNVWEVEREEKRKIPKEQSKKKYFKLLSGALVKTLQWASISADGMYLIKNRNH